MDLFEYAALQAAPPAPPPLFDCPLRAALPASHADWAHPVFSLARHAPAVPRRFAHGRGSVEIVPGPMGPATILDKDVFVHAVTRLVEAREAGRVLEPCWDASLREILIATGRGTTGKDYPAIVAALERVSGMRVELCFANRRRRVLRLLAARVHRARSGRVLATELAVPDWVVAAVAQGRELALGPGYAGLRRPLERRLHEIAREGVERIDLPALLALTGARSTPKRFRELLRDVIRRGGVPGVRVALDGQRVTLLTW